MGCHYSVGVNEFFFCVMNWRLPRNPSEIHTGVIHHKCGITLGVKKFEIIEKSIEICNLWTWNVVKTDNILIAKLRSTLHYITLHYITLPPLRILVTSDALSNALLHYITAYHMPVTPTVTNGASTNSFKFSECKLKKMSFQKFFENISICLTITGTEWYPDADETPVRVDT